MHILGISAFYHDSAACLVVDGEVHYAVQEERFSRKKHDARFPRQGVAWCLESAGLRLSDIDRVVFYDKPLLKFERLLETYLTFAPQGLRSFISSMPVWLKEKLFLDSLLKKELATLPDRVAGEIRQPILYPEHHLSHAASAFFPSPYESAAVLTVDGVGEWTTTSYGRGQGNQLEILADIRFPHSLGLLYSAFTYYTGFKVNSGEYKVMGLAPYGRPVYVQAIYDHLIDLKDDGSFQMNMEFFDYCTGLRMTSRRFDEVFGGPPRRPESQLTQREMDLARSVQEVVEEVMLRIARHVHKETGERHLCLAGGVALNCVANGRILREGPFDGIWIQPAAGDAGGALGAALAAWHLHEGQPRHTNGSGHDGMRGAYLGPRFDAEVIRRYLDGIGAVFEEVADSHLFDRVADLLAAGKVVGWFQGPMEFGPRALGGRSILGDPRNSKMQSVMNLKIKYRESFRPFAPSVLAERAAEYFDLKAESPYMLLVTKVREDRCIPMDDAQQQLFGIEKLNVPRSDIPAITHVDYSARVQTVHAETNPRYHALIQAFARKTGCAIVVNTSFNVRGEPIVCSPEDAYRCFMRTEMDALVLENFLLHKEGQPAWREEGDWREEFELD